jgi:hypothetical protein
MMQASALAVVFRETSAFSIRGRLRPTYEAAPAWIIWRREIRGPGQEVITMSRGMSGMAGSTIIVQVRGLIKEIVASRDD